MKIAIKTRISLVICLLLLACIACNKKTESSTDISWTGENTYVYTDSIPFVFIKRITFNADAGIQKSKIEKIVYKSDNSTSIDVVFEKVIDSGKTQSLDAEIFLDSKSLDLKDVSKIVYSMEMKDNKNKLHSQHITILIEHKTVE